MQKKDTRCYGIDLLKTISMFFVVLIHMLGDAGGVLTAIEYGSVPYWSTFYLWVSSYCAVNCFAMATGYLMVNRTFRYRKIVPLWLNVAFYSVALIVINLLVSPESLGIGAVFYFLPATTSMYWYFTAYFGMFFFIPFLNRLISTLSKDQYIVLLTTGFILFCVEHSIILVGADAFKMSTGYSMWWLIYLYFLGAGIKKYEFFKSISIKKAMTWYVAAAALTMANNMIVSYFMENPVEIITEICELYGKNRLAVYISPTIVIEAISLMVICLKVEIPDLAKSFLQKIAPLIFQVYLIHLLLLDGVSYTSQMVKGYFQTTRLSNPVSAVGKALLVTGLVFTVSLLLDLPRAWLFRVCKVPQRVDRLADWVTYKGKKLLLRERFQKDKGGS